MEQQIQQKSMQPVKTATQKPLAGQTQPVEGKSKWWIWLIIALVVIGAGIGFYYWFAGF